MSRIKRLSLLLCISVLILAGCKDNSKNENVADNSKSAKTEKEIVGYAAIHLEDGRTIELKPSSISGSAGDPNRLTANMRDNGIIVMLRLTSMERPIKEKEYDNSDNSIDIGITAKGYIKDGPLEEEYRSYYYKNEDGKEGEAKITITYRGDNHSEGTFSGTLYSKSHKKAVIEGKFTLKKKKK